MVEWAEYTCRRCVGYTAYGDSGYWQRKRSRDELADRSRPRYELNLQNRLNGWLYMNMSKIGPSIEKPSGIELQMRIIRRIDLQRFEGYVTPLYPRFAGLKRGNGNTGRLWQRFLSNKMIHDLTIRGTKCFFLPLAVC